MKYRRSVSRNYKSQERGKSFEIPKSELFKKVEENERKLDKMEKSINEMMEMMRKSKYEIHGRRDCSGC